MLTAKRYVASPRRRTTQRFADRSPADWRIVHRIADSHVDKMAEAVKQSFDHLRRSVDVTALADTIAHGVDNIDWAEVDLDLQKRMLPVSASIARASSLALLPSFKDNFNRRLKQLRFVEPTAFEQLEFGLKSYDAEQFLKYQFKMPGVSLSTQTAVRDVILNGFQHGMHPYDMAQQIKSVIGLSPAQVKAYERLSAQLTDQKVGFDKLVSQLDRYADAAREQRARTIARTETIRASNAGQAILWDHARDGGFLESTTMQSWIATPDDRECEWCAAQEGTTVPIGASFDNAAFGSVAYPPLHPDCRCTMGLDFETVNPDSSFMPGMPGGMTPEEAAQMNPDWLTPEEEAAIAEDLNIEFENVVAEQSPIPVGDLAYIKSLGGSTGATLKRDPVTGDSFVDKGGNSEGHIRSEYAADQAYKAAGFETTESIIIETMNGPIKRARYLEPSITLADWWEQETPPSREIMRKKLQSGLAMDSLLGNWDVIGLEGDNILIDGMDNPIRVDNGGSLRYRAQGALKSPAQFDKHVSEINTFRDSSQGTWATRMFSGTTDEELWAQVQKLDARRNEILATLPVGDRPLISLRLDNMIEQLKPVEVHLPIPTADASNFLNLPKSMITELVDAGLPTNIIVDGLADIPVQWVSNDSTGLAPELTGPIAISSKLTPQDLLNLGYKPTTLEEFRALDKFKKGLLTQDEIDTVYSGADTLEHVEQNPFVEHVEKEVLPGVFTSSEISAIKNFEKKLSLLEKEALSNLYGPDEPLEITLAAGMQDLGTDLYHAMQQLRGEIADEVLMNVGTLYNPAPGAKFVKKVFDGIFGVWVDVAGEAGKKLLMLDPLADVKIVEEVGALSLTMPQEIAKFAGTLNEHQQKVFNSLYPYKSISDVIHEAVGQGTPVAEAINGLANQLGVKVTPTGTVSLAAQVKLTGLPSLEEVSKAIWADPILKKNWDVISPYFDPNTLGLTKLMEKLQYKTVTGFAKYLDKELGGGAPVGKTFKADPNATRDAKGYRTFDQYNTSSMEAWGRSWIDRSTITNAERTAIEGYGDGAYSDLNEALRQWKDQFDVDKIRSGSSQRYIPSLDAAMSRAGGVPEAVRVYRGSDATIFNDIVTSDVNGHPQLDHAIGKTIRDWGFTSTSLSSSAVFSGGVKFEISVPKGTKALYINATGASTMGEERELLLNRGTKFRIDRVEKKTDPHNYYAPRWTVHMTVVP